jgi:hypothetical protein
MKTQAEVILQNIKWMLNPLSGPVQLAVLAEAIAFVANNLNCSTADVVFIIQEAMNGSTDKKIPKKKRCQKND